MPRKSLGEFEQLVLLACLRCHPSAYAVSILDEIRLRTRREPTHAAVYIALRRLEERGLVRSALGASTPTRGGRPRRFFEVQPAAIEQLKASRQALLSLWEDLETL